MRQLAEPCNIDFERIHRDVDMASRDADASDAAMWIDPVVTAFPQKETAWGIKKAGMRLGATWQWAQVVVEQWQIKMGPSDSATWRDPTVCAISQNRDVRTLRNAGMRDCATWQQARTGDDVATL